MTLSLASRVRLNDGNQMPLFGLGVWQASPEDTRYAVSKALETGYRLIDTAKLYRNEADVGQSVRESGLPREEVFVTTKLWNSDHGYDAALRAAEESNARLGLEYMDLYLIHYPVQKVRHESWRALARIKQDGLARSIGVSNYTVRHLEELMEKSDVVPTVNQVEFHPFLYQKELLDFCRRHDIRLEAYCPLTQGQRLDHPTIAKVAAKYGKTPAQILIRWGLEHEVIEIPKSVKEHRIRENSSVFDFAIAADDMALLDGLNENLHTSWDPSNEP
jgi:diketogulonate reductase-like aldo/keto reductase